MPSNLVVAGGGATTLAARARAPARPDAGAVYYAYDVSGRKISLKDPDLRENVYVYDAAGRLNRVVIDALNASYYEYDASGLVTRRAMPTNAVISYFTYEAATARLKQLNVRNAAGSLLAYFAYQRNANGMETWIRREGGLNVYHTYDALDRLTREDWRGSSATLYGFGYDYDAASNRSVKQSLAAAANTYYSYDANNRLQREVVAQTGVATDYVYDSSRRAKLRHSPSAATYFTHNQRSQATTVSFAGVASGPHYLSYDGVGERVRIRTGSTETYLAWDHRKLLQERLPGGTVLRRYRNNDGENDSRGFLVLKEDLEFGALYAVFDADGNVIAEGPAAELRSAFGERFTGALPNGQRVAVYPLDEIRLDSGQQLQSTGDGAVSAPSEDWKTTPDGGEDTRDLSECCTNVATQRVLVEAGRMKDAAGNWLSTVGSEFLSAGPEAVKAVPGMVVGAAEKTASLAAGAMGWGFLHAGYDHASKGLAGQEGLLSVVWGTLADGCSREVALFMDALGHDEMEAMAGLIAGTPGMGPDGGIQFQGGVLQLHPKAVGKALFIGFTIVITSKCCAMLKSPPPVGEFARAPGGWASRTIRPVEPAPPGLGASYRFDPATGGPLPPFRGDGVSGHFFPEGPSSIGPQLLQSGVSQETRGVLKGIMGGDTFIVDHVEGAASALMRRFNIRRGTLMINDPEGTCLEVCEPTLQWTLPPGSRLTVQGPIPLAPRVYVGPPGGSPPPGHLSGPLRSSGR